MFILVFLDQTRSRRFDTVIAWQVIQILNRMQLPATEGLQEGPDPQICIQIPPTRSDVLHPCDVMEVRKLMRLFCRVRLTVLDLASWTTSSAACIIMHQCIKCIAVSLSMVK